MSQLVTRVLLVLAILCPAAAQAAWPERSVTIVVPFAAGGITDLLARLTAERLQAVFGQPFVVDNQLGAAGIIATERVARAAPDGYTLLFATTSQITVAPYTNKISYDPVKAFRPISVVATAPFFITVRGDFPARTLDEFIAAVKAQPGKLTYGMAGYGSLTHLASATFLKEAGLDMIPVPYKGIGPAFTDLLAGNIQMMSASPVELQPYRDGKLLRLLAVSSPRRTPAYPQVPAIAEKFPGHQVVTWNGLLAPAGVPDDVIDALSHAIMAAETSDDFTARLRKLGVEPVVQTPQDFAALITRELTRWHETATALDIKPE